MKIRIIYFLLLVGFLKLEVFCKTYDAYKKTGSMSKYSDKKLEKNLKDDSLSPKIKWNKIKSEDSGSIVRSYISPNSETFALLAFNSYDDIKNWSRLYISRDFGDTIEKINLLYENQEVIVDDVFINGNTIIAVDKKLHLFFSSNDSGLSFTNHTTGYGYIETVIFHPKNSTYVAAITENGGRLYISKDGGGSFRLQDYNVQKFTWSPLSQYYYYIGKTILDEYYHILTQGDGDIRYDNEYIMENVTNLQASNDLVYVTTYENSKLILHISQNDGPFRMAQFPQKLNATNFEVRHSTKNDVFVSIYSETDKRYLYSALLVDLRFVRIAEMEPYQFHDDLYLICNDVKIFENLPGVLIGNIKTEHIGKTLHPSMISFTHGAHWAHVVPPLTDEISECNWPSCYFSLIQSCNPSYDEIITPTKSPNLVLAHGNIVDKNITFPTNFYISSDAGLSWHLAMKGVHSFTVLNHGSVIAAYPEQSNRIYYSYDEGREWKSSLIGIGDFYAQVVYHDESSTAFASVAVGYDNDDGTAVIVKSDFSEVLVNKCNQNDYTDFTPGANSRNKCFQGKKNSYKRRIHEVLCYNSDDELISPNSVDCPCTEDDFGCNFGNYMNEGRCVTDPDYIEEEPKPCSFGTFYSKDSKTRKLLGDSCIGTNETEKNIGICGLDEESRSIVIRVGNTYRIMNLEDGIPQNLVNFPMNDKLKSTSNSFAVDLSKSCLFFSTGVSIRQLCWKTFQDAEISESKLYINDKDIHSIQIDNVAQNIYFQDSFGINILSIENRYRKLIIPNQYPAIFKIFPTLGLLITVDSNIYNNQILITFNDMNGTVIKSCDLDGLIFAISESSKKSTFEIYAADSLVEMDINCTLKNISPNNNKDIIDVDFKYGTRYLLTTNGIIYNSSLIAHPLLNEMHIYDERDLKLNPCSKSLCQYLCTPGIGNTYTCLCPNNMKVVDKTNCECDDSHPDCKACEGNEFKCDNDKCVSINAKCNGVNDCGDSSDEKSCKYTCDADQFVCSDNTTCFGIEFLCDGVKNCQDGSDEKDCKQTNPCGLNDFTCMNGICVPKDRVCDGQNNCGDYSDEENCKNENCKNFEFACKNGGCILREYVCDGKFDCLDWSDEEDCKTDGSNSTKPENCTIECDGVCIPKSKVCNHITDCKNKMDELDCGYELECPSDFNLVCPKQSLCYSKDFVCDGFDTCSDGADEVGCSENIYCQHPYNFRCKTTDQCIPSSKYCNGIPDCTDNSDEDDNCLINPRVTTVLAFRVTFNSVNLTIRSINRKPDQQYLVSVIPWKHNKTQNITILTLDEHVFIDNLAPCSEYIAYVKFSGNSIGAKRDFVTHTIIRQTPQNLVYNDKDSVLSWNFHSYSCQPAIFYVECESGGNIIYQNFTKLNYTSVSAKNTFNCRISSCGVSVFNLTCSQFSDSLKVKYNSNKGSNVAIAIIVIVCLSGLAVGCYLLYKFLQNKRITFTIPTRFRRLFTTRGGPGLSDDHDRLISGDDEDDLLDSI